MSLLTDKEKARFQAKVDVRANDECWPWKGAKTSRGYGALNIGGRQWPAHRVAFALAWGLVVLPNPRKIFICHKCDNPECCNPQHLFMGTPKDNMDDMDRKGRRVACNTNPALGDRHGSKTHPERIRRGESHAMVKLTEEEVRAIRCSTLSGVKLAEFFRISENNISRIRRFKIWRHLDEVQP
jgi:hypothetical protein